MNVEEKRELLNFTLMNIDCEIYETPIARILRYYCECASDRQRERGAADRKVKR
jgi:hypothetical protein